MFYENDLISREALKKAFYNQECWNVVIEHIIDNAPTIELNESIIQEVLNKRCMTAVANEYLVALHSKRPQGKWITHQTGLILWDECDQCGAQVGTIGMNYCPNCGAKMDGG